MLFKTISPLLAGLLLAALSAGVSPLERNWNLPQPNPTSANLLSRHYKNGEKLSYWMTGVNQGHHYKIRADGMVKKLADGTYVEEYAWTNLTREGTAVSLSAASITFRQIVSLDPKYRMSIPDLSHVQAGLIGPITDFLTFYSDLWLAVRNGQLNHAGDHFYFKFGRPSSWADGRRVVLGESSIDFDLTLAAVDRAMHTATLVVRHVPPAQPGVKLLADWMRAPVAGTPNNWVEVEKQRDGRYRAEVGKETFAMKMKVSLIDGRIISGNIDDTVEATERECADADLTNCGTASPEHIQRTIGLKEIR